MRQRFTTLALGALSLAAGLTTWAAVARGQAAPAARPAAPPAEQIQALRKDLDELRSQTVQIPTLAAAVEELTTRLAHLEQELERIRRAQASIPDAVSRLDSLDTQVRALAREVANVRGELSALEHPSGSLSGEGAGYDDGFVWESADSAYRARLSGYIVPRYEASIAAGDLDSSNIRLRNARVSLDGHAGGLTYRLLLSAIGEIPALDAYVDYALSKALAVQAGQYKTQFFRSYITSSTRLAFAERPDVINNFRYDRDLQVGIHGMLADDRVSYYAGIGNGAGANRVNDNVDVNVTVRGDLVLLGKRFAYGFGDLVRTEEPTLMLGGGAVHDLVTMPSSIGEIAVTTDVDGDGTTDNVRVISASADAVFRYRGVELLAEAVFRYEDFGAIFDHSGNQALLAAVGERDSRTYLGGIGQITYAFPSRLLIGASAGRSRTPFLGVGGRASSIPPGTHLTELHGTVQYFRDARYRLIGVLYTLRNFDSDNGPDPADDIEHRLIVETMLKF